MKLFSYFLERVGEKFMFSAKNETMDRTFR